MNKISLFFFRTVFSSFWFLCKNDFFLETIRTKHSLRQKDNVILMLLSGLDSRPLNKLSLPSLSGSWSVPVDRRYVICPSIICPTHHLSYTVGENFICPTHHAFVLRLICPTHHLFYREEIPSFVLHFDCTLHFNCPTEREKHHLSYNCPTEIQWFSWNG